MNRCDSRRRVPEAIAGKDWSLAKSAVSRTASGSTRPSPAKAAKAREAAAPKKAAVKKSVKAAPAVAKVVARKQTVAAAKNTAALPVSNAMLDLVVARLEDMKAEQTVVIDVRGRSLFADHMVVTSGRSNRHVASVAEAVAKSLKEAGHKSVHVEGLTNADWVLIDTGDVTVHIFRPEVREFYNLERLWTHGPEALAKPA